MRVFLDTNVLASAFTATGVCAELFRQVIDNHELLTSEQVLTELERILPRQFGASTEQIAAVLTVLRRYHVEAHPRKLPKINVRDADDLAILAAAIAASADVLVTGDKDLFAVVKSSPVRIVSPRGFLEML